MEATRRSALLGAAGLFAAGTAGSNAQPASAGNVKALVFDVFGTCVDWRNGVARDAERILKPLGYELNWIAFADAWRALYQPTLEEVRSGRAPFVKLDVLHRRMLDQIRPNSVCRSWTKKSRTISIWPGTGLMPGPTCRPALRGFIANSFSRPARTAISR